MADAASVTDDQKRALLSAVAQQGTAGAQAYQQYSDSVQAQRQAAVQAAQQRSSLINAGPAADAQLSGSAVATSDPYAKDAATGATAYANENARLGQANSAYMDQVKAAIPVAEAKASAAIAKRDAAAKAKKGAAAANNPFAQLIASLGGEGLAKAQLGPVLKGAIDQSAKDAFAGGIRGGFGGAGNFIKHGEAAGATQTPEGKKSTIDAIGQALGLQPGVLESFLGKQSPDYVAPAAKVPLSVQNKATTAKIHTDPTYKSTFSAAQKQINAYANQKDAKGHHVMSRTQAKAQVISDLRGDSTYGSRQAIYDQIIRDLK